MVVFKMFVQYSFFVFTIICYVQYQSKASRQFAQPSLLRLGEKKAKAKTTI